MKIYIIILNWNKKDLLLDCLRSLEKIEPFLLAAVTLLVVDNASTDDSPKAVKEFAKKHSLKFASGTEKSLKKKTGRVPPIRLNSHKPTVTLIENKTNLGYAEGNNKGMEYALKRGADYLLILNNDIEVDKDFLVQLISTMGGSASGGEVARKGKGVGIVSPKIYFAPGYEFHKERYQKTDLGKVIWYAGGLIDWDNILSAHRGVDMVEKGQYDKVVETDYASGSCMLIKREVLEEVGLFDKKLFMYWEDADFSQRAKKAGWQVLYAPQAKIWHKVAASSAIGGALNDYYLIRNRLLFGLRYARLRTKIALAKDSLRILLKGRKWQKIGVADFYLGRFGKGSYG